ncbi:MAG: hypothetical protein HON32_07110 [Francisellaceae bacterium]|jgi:hypothetical protein|nr:hypothetical protein [Francisellaceae bacterium]MBT6539758.1 hypothetical protein [Francisellaceae bacterium]
MDCYDYFSYNNCQRNNIRKSMIKNTKKFGEYVQFLRENIGNLVEYREMTGSSEPGLVKVKTDLFDEDPFVVFGATLLATAAFSDKTLYH